MTSFIHPIKSPYTQSHLPFVKQDQRTKYMHLGSAHVTLQQQICSVQINGSRQCLSTAPQYGSALAAARSDPALDDEQPCWPRWWTAVSLSRRSCRGQCLTRPTSTGGGGVWPVRPDRRGRVTSRVIGSTKGRWQPPLLSWGCSFPEKNARTCFYYILSIVHQRKYVINADKKPHLKNVIDCWLAPGKPHECIQSIVPTKRLCVILTGKSEKPEN